MKKLTCHCGEVEAEINLPNKLEKIVVLISEKDSKFLSNRFSIIKLPVKLDDINSVSYAAYRLILHRFNNSPGNDRIIGKANSLMNILGLDTNFFVSGSLSIAITFVFGKYSIELLYPASP